MIDGIIWELHLQPQGSKAVALPGLDRSANAVLCLID